MIGLAVFFGKVPFPGVEWEHLGPYLGEKRGEHWFALKSEGDHQPAIS